MQPVLMYHVHLGKLMLWSIGNKSIREVDTTGKGIRCGGKVIAIGTSLLHIGGYAEYRDVEEICLLTYTVRPTAPMLIPRKNPGLLRYSHHLYVFAGHFPVSHQSTSEYFDLSTRLWHSLPNLPHSHPFSFTPVSYLTRIYLPAFSGCSEIDIFDTQTHTFFSETLVVFPHFADSVSLIIGEEMVLLDYSGRKVSWSLNTGDMRREFSREVGVNVQFATIFQVNDGIYWMDCEKIVKSDLKLTNFRTLVCN